MQVQSKLISSCRCDRARVAQLASNQEDRRDQAGRDLPTCDSLAGKEYVEYMYCMSLLLYLNSTHGYLTLKTTNTTLMSVDGDDGPMGALTSTPAVTVFQSPKR